MNGDGSLRPAWVILTMGTRPEELTAAVDSVHCQDVSGQVLVVAQGAGIVVPSGADVLQLKENVGIPGGRDAGMRAVDADVVFFLDDDARYTDSTVASRTLGMMSSRPELAAVSLRIVDDDGHTLQRHLPRLGRGSAGRSGDVTTFLGGACAIRRDAYLAVGGYDPGFFYGHEEMDLAWRLIESDSAIAYDATPGVVHPHVALSEGNGHRWRLLGRNRVWLARRRLPHPIDWIHSVLWLLIEMVRTGAAGSRRGYWDGWRSGWIGEVERDPLSWSTGLRMTRMGRPPFI